MSTATSFAKHAFLAKIGNIGDGIISWYSQHDPETASAADIAQLREHVIEIEHRIAEIGGKVEHDQHEIEGLVAKLARDQQAATALGERLQKLDASDTINQAKYTEQLNRILIEIESLAGSDGSCKSSGRIFEAQQTLDMEKADLAEFTEAHRQSVADWTGAQARLDRAQADMQHAQQQEAAAQERAARAERDAGLLRRPSSGTVALNAMEQAAEQARQNARAAQLRADTLKHTTGGDVDSIVSDVLSDKPQSNDVMDRLARLTGKR